MSGIRVPVCQVSGYQGVRYQGTSVSGMQGTSVSGMQGTSVSGMQGTRVSGIRVPVYMCQVSGYQGEVSGYSGVRYQRTRVPGCPVSGYRGIVLFILGSFSLMIVHSTKSLK